jgi:hypothetical protein
MKCGPLRCRARGPADAGSSWTAGVDGLAWVPAFPHNEHNHHCKHDCEPYGFDRPRSFNDHRKHDHDSDDAEHDHPKPPSHGHSVWVRLDSRPPQPQQRPQDPAILPTPDPAPHNDSERDTERVMPPENPEELVRWGYDCSTARKCAKWEARCSPESMSALRVQTPASASISAATSCIALRRQDRPDSDVQRPAGRSRNRGLAA